MSERLFGRRDLFRAAGATLMVPSFLRDAFAATSPAAPRLVIIMQAVGTHQQTFWPDAATGTSPILEPILSQPALAAKTLLIKGVVNQTQGFGNEHDRGFHSLWTGVAPVGSPEDSFGGGPSIDQMLKQQLKPAVMFPTLNCGVLASEVAPKNGHRRSFSYLGPKQQLSTMVDPYRLYAMLFRDPRVAGDPGAAQRRLMLRQSVLDHTARDLTTLSARLGPSERRKLDAHATALREYENRLAASATSGASSCARPSTPLAGLDPAVEDNFPALTDLMLDLVAVALACNLTRIVTFQLGLCGNQMRYRWLGIDKDCHSDIAHQDTFDGSNVLVAETMTKISRWYAEKVARLAARLDGIPEANGTALDSSLVIWANENGTGFHNLDNLPIVFMGRAAGRLTRTGVVDEGAQSHHRLGTSVMQLMGAPVTGFGDQPNAGPLQGVA